MNYRNIFLVDGNNSFVTENFIDNRGFYPQLEHFALTAKEMEESESDAEPVRGMCRNAWRFLRTEMKESTL